MTDTGGRHRNTRNMEGHHIIEALGEYTSDTGVSVENVTEVVNINTEGTTYYTQVLYRVGGGCGEGRGKGKECFWPVCSQV